ncbi:hypothetical protein KKC52_13385, partial [bacterium]|nr:hypothetical protein [bacterium]
MEGMIRKGLMVILCLGLVLSWGLKAKAETFSLAERDKEEMRMERSNRNGLFDRLKSREEERRLRQMPDERRREYEEQEKAKRAKRSMRSPGLRAGLAQAQAGTKLTDHQFNMALDGFPNNDILFLSDRGGQFDLWKMDGSGNNKTQLTNDLEIEVINGGVAVSPSGQKIAYVSFDFNSGQTHFYVMNADGSSRIEIDVSSEWWYIDIEDNSWSPDSQWILYEKAIESGGDHQIWAVKADGTGKKQLPEEMGWTGNLSWSPDSNWIVYADYQSDSRGIYKISPSGGQPIAIVTSTTGFFGDPTYSPDGNWIVYTDYNRLCKIPSSGGQPIAIVTETSPCNINDPVYSPNGTWITYSKNDWENNSYNIVYVVSSNGGTPVLISGEGGDLIWSPDSQWLLYESNDGTWAVRADGTDKNRLLEEGLWGGKIFFLSSPTRIVYDNGMKDIYTLPLTGGSPTKLTNNLYSSAINFGPVFSPDGNKMAYITMPNKDATGLSWKMGLWVMNKDGSGKKEILSSADIEEVAWSPDGNWIAYSYEDWNNDVYGIYKISPDGGTPIPIVSSTNDFAGLAWSPDGKDIAYCAYDGDSNRGIYTVDVDTLVTATIVSTGWLSGPTYSPDGKDIAYVYGDWQNNEHGIYTIGVDSLVTATIVSSATGYNNPTYSPDGNYIAYVYYGLQSEHEYNSLHVASSDGSSSWLVYESDDLEDFCWSPDSTRLAFTGEFGCSYYTNLDGS